MSFKLIYLARRNPAVAFEDWPRTWRSHAVYVSQFPVVGAAIDRLFYCARMGDAPAGFSTDHDGVALVFSESKEKLGGTMQPDNEALIEADERRVFGRPVDEFSLHAEESAADGGETGGAAVIRFLARKPEISAEAFAARLADGHRAVASALVAPGGPLLRHSLETITGTPPPGYGFDAVSIGWLDTPEAALAAAGGGAFAAIEADLAEFCDTGRSVSLLTRVIHRWPRT